jgi:hypothetical protein
MHGSLSRARVFFSHGTLGLTTWEKSPQILNFYCPKLYFSSSKSSRRVRTRRTDPFRELTGRAAGQLANPTLFRSGNFITWKKMPQILNFSAQNFIFRAQNLRSGRRCCTDPFSELTGAGSQPIRRSFSRKTYNIFTYNVEKKVLNFELLLPETLLFDQIPKDQSN